MLHRLFLLTCFVAACTDEASPADTTQAPAPTEPAPPPAAVPPVMPPMMPPPAPMCTPELGPQVTEHVCLHATHGPFKQAMAAASTPGPSVAKSHTMFQLTLPSADGAYRGTVRYRSREGGLLAFYTTPAVTLRLVGPHGELTTLGTQAIAATCAKLEQASFWRLEADVDYHVTIGPSLGASVGFAAEHIEEFDEPWASCAPTP